LNRNASLNISSTRHRPNNVTSQITKELTKGNSQTLGDLNYINLFEQGHLLSAFHKNLIIS
jgi:hypothetical protein